MIKVSQINIVWMCTEEDHEMRIVLKAVNGRLRCLEAFVCSWCGIQLLENTTNAINMLIMFSISLKTYAVQYVNVEDMF